MEKIVMIGSGNVATHLGKALMDAGHRVLQVYSPTEEHAATLAGKLGVAYTDDIKGIVTDADIYLFAVKDSFIGELAREISGRVVDTSVFIHTSGSTPVSIFQDTVKHYGVLYPLQTFSVARDVDFQAIPCFVEGDDKETEDKVRSLAESVSDKVVMMNSEQRRLMHLAAVWSCNFVNHCYDIADGLMKQCDLPFDLLLPLIDETARKVHELSPRQAQTGPAVRFDRRIIDAHLALMADKPLQAEIYEKLSESICQHYNDSGVKNEEIK